MSSIVDTLLDYGAKAGDYVLDRVWEEGDWFGTGEDVGAELVSDDYGLGEWLGDGDAGITYAGGAGGAAMAVAQQLVAAVLRNPIAMELLAQAAGFVFGRAPNYQGQPMNAQMVAVMFKELPKKSRKPLAQRLAGLDSPIGLTKPEQIDFLMLVLYDALRAQNITNLDALDCSDCAY